MKLTTGKTVTFEITANGIDSEEITRRNTILAFEHRFAQMIESRYDGEETITFTFECQVNAFSLNLIQSVKEELKSLLEAIK